MDGDIIARYRAGASMRELAEYFHTSAYTIRQTLLTAGEPIKPRGRQRMAVSSDAIAELYDAGLEFEEIADRLGVHPQSVRSRYNEIRSQRGLVRQGRWHRFLLKALEQQPRVVIVTEVAEHLGREPTKNEAHAVRRAARDLSLRGSATLDYESVTGRRGSYLVIVRNRDAEDQLNPAPAVDRAAPAGSRKGHIPWYELFDDALTTQPIVAVDRIAEAHLGRTPTRTEFTAAHRAAHGYARAGNAQAFDVWTRRGDGHHKVRVLLLARTDADLDDTDQLLAAALSRPVPSEPRGTTLQTLLASIKKGAQACRRLNIDDVEPTCAQHHAADIAAAVDDFRRLHDRLLQHGRANSSADTSTSS